MTRAYNSGLFEFEAGYPPLGYSQIPLDRQWFVPPQMEAESVQLPPIDPRPFGGNSQLQTEAMQLAQLRGSRVVNAEVERLYRRALQAAEQAARRARSNIAAARAAVSRPDPAQVQRQATTEYETWLTENYRLTVEGARARYGEHWRNQMRRLNGQTERQAYYDNQLGQVSRAWLISRREQLDFNTLAAANVRSLPQSFGPPAAEVERVVSPLIPGSQEERVAPIVVTFVQELKKRYPGCSATTYRNHGGGAFLRRGYSLDLYINSERDNRGFYLPSAAEAFLRQVHEAARAVNVEWRVLYNDFAVADAINRATGVRHVVFVGQPRTAQRNGKKYGTGLNWHGPHPLILHFHLDIAPLATTARRDGYTAESGRLAFQARDCRRLEAEYCFMASRLRSLPREIANKKYDLQSAEHWLNHWRCQNWPQGIRQTQAVAKMCQEQATKVQRIRNELAELERQKADFEKRLPDALRSFRFNCPNRSMPC